MSTLSPSGDWMQAVALPMHWSNQNPSPSQNGDENVLTYGNVRATIKDDLVQVKVGGLTIDITSDSTKITIGGVTHDISGDGVFTDGGRIDHEGKNIGKDHKHQDVEPGPSLTGVPVP
jgi:hypothetical protein